MEQSMRTWTAEMKTNDGSLEETTVWMILLKSAHLVMPKQSEYIEQLCEMCRNEMQHLSQWRMSSKVLEWLISLDQKKGSIKL